MSDSFLRMQARTQRFTLGSPRQFAVSPDGARVLFLRSASGEDRSHQLWQLDVATGQESVLADPAALLGGDEELSPEERARRERAREQAAGVVGLATDADARVVAFALSGKVFVAVDGQVRALETATPVVDPRPDPTGQHVAYVSANAMRVIAVDGSGDRALAEPETEEHACGVAEFIAAEEMDRSRGYWWSPDGTRLLVSFTDRTPVQRWYIADPANPGTEPTKVAYPAAGTPNVVTTVGVVDLDGNRVDVDWDNEALPYLVTAHWSAGGPPLIAVQSRDQRTIQVRSIDPATGATELVFEQTDDTWVDIVPGVPAWTADGQLVTVQALDGAYRLVIGDKAVTGDTTQVRSVLDVGEDVLFTASLDDPRQIHVFTGDTGGAVQVSTADGVHGGARGGNVTVLSSWSLDYSGPRVRVLRDGADVGTIRSEPVQPPLTPNVRFATVGERALRTAVLYPTGHQPGSGKLPVLVSPYGGPHAQMVLASRNAYLTSQWFADQGFAVVITDGRGTPGRGPAWDREIHHNFASVTLKDQIDALQALADSHPDLDMDRVAIRGWSYGGYLSALAAMRRPDVFHAAIAGAPVTDWTLYDTHYTERYLGHPDEEPEVYKRNSLMDDADNLRARLMIIHGLADDNVVVAHGLRLSAALTAAGKPHALVPLVAVTHMTPQDEQTAENFLMMQVRWLFEALDRGQS
ncbi:dipeptidyl-peptidase-4 [Labedaea rhizosphaerae]|uniref:Dipeptidyl-peptidase-4 n=2 Tax=Labedaea rhizosphaerae TaxID=598644 RepID=A0A4R6SI71_LABRH|nr:dipeptidyl-peptidase-4 [Labedaea rhizosphaerae]